MTFASYYFLEETNNKVLYLKFKPGKHFLASQFWDAKIFILWVGSVLQ